MRRTTIVANNLREANRKARARFRGNLVVDRVKKIETTFEVITKMRKRHLRKR